MANAGRVEMNLLAVGEDQLSAMLLKVNANVDQMKGKMQQAAAATNLASNAQAGFTDRIKNAIKPVDGLRSVFNAVRENVMFLLPGLGGLAAAFVGLATDIFDTEKKLDATTQAMFHQAGKAAALTREIGAIGVAASNAAKATQGFEVRIAQLGAQIARVQGNTQLAEVFEREAKAAAARGSIKAVETQLESADKAANDALARVYESRKALSEAQTQSNILIDNIKATEAASGLINERDRARLAAVSVAVGQQTVNAQLAEKAFKEAAKASSQYAEELVYLDTLTDAEAKAKPKGTGGGGGGGGGGRAPRVPQVPEVDTSPRILSTDPDVMAILEGRMPMAIERVSAELPIARWEELRSEVELTSKVMLDFLSTIDRAAQAAFPDLGAGLQEVSALTVAYQERVAALNSTIAKDGSNAAEVQVKATDALTTALIGGGTAIAASVAKTLGGLRAEYIVRSAGEFAAGVASSFTNPAEAASHFSASVLYGIAAAKAGGGGGGGGSKGGGGGGTQRTSQTGQITGSGSGGGTTVFNFSTLVTDRQQVRQAVNEVMARRDRSGYRQREGA